MARLRELNPRDAARERRLRLTYGIGVADYAAILKAQGGCCAICRRPPARRRFCVDHNHKTGQVRGLLCFRCNYALPFYRDSGDSLRAAAVYVETPPAEAVIGYHLVPVRPKRRRSRRRRARAARSGSGTCAVRTDTPASTTLD